LSAAATIPIVSHKGGDDTAPVSDTLEKSLLTTSEEERRVQKYGVNKDRSIFFRFFRSIKVTFLKFIYEPIATGLRFIQLVAIFVPVFATIPVIFIGSRDPKRDNDRSGTLWWYSFLVSSMERAGPTFIKVVFAIATLTTAWAMGRLTNGHISR
jgi:aarF domain-containing kinase